MTTDRIATQAPEEVAARLSVVLGQLIRVLRRQTPVTIGPGSLAALATLHRCGPLRLGDLALREGVAPPTLTRMVAVLEEGGHLTRRPDPDDRRAVQVSITAAGSELVESALGARAVVLQARLAALPDDARQALVRALPALEALADDAL